MQLIETRTKLLRQAVERMQYADQIRNLISKIKDKAIAQGDARELDHWAAWAAWAVEQADAIDPRTQNRESTKAWIQKFRVACYFSNS